ncbi:MAG: hypothetical protein LBC41_16665 [Clostridiales bacterium]|nr:hypothetical protein [Clostridiales bacterium]
MTTIARMYQDEIDALISKIDEANIRAEKANNEYLANAKEALEVKKLRLATELRTADTELHTIEMELKMIDAESKANEEIAALKAELELYKSRSLENGSQSG